MRTNSIKECAQSTNCRFQRQRFVFAVDSVGAAGWSCGKRHKNVPYRIIRKASKDLSEAVNELMMRCDVPATTSQENSTERFISQISRRVAPLVCFSDRLDSGESSWEMRGLWLGGPQSVHESHCGNVAKNVRFGGSG